MWCISDVTAPQKRHRPWSRSSTAFRTLAGIDFTNYPLKVEPDGADNRGMGKEEWKTMYEVWHPGMGRWLLVQKRDGCTRTVVANYSMSGRWPSSWTESSPQSASKI